MILFNGLRHWLAVLLGILMMLLSACGSGSAGGETTDSVATPTQASATPTEAYDSVECQRLLDLNYNIQLKDLESLVTQCEALLQPMLNALNGVTTKPGNEQMAAFNAVRSSKPMMYATQLSGYLYLGESLEGVPAELRDRARRQTQIAGDLQKALNETLASMSSFDPGVDDGH